MRRLLGSIVAAATTVTAALALGSPALSPAQGGQLEVGVGVEDGSWHVGASAGQYAGAPEDPPPSQEQPTGNVANFVEHENETFDPTGHSTRRYPSYGIQSRLSVRAIVIDDGNGDRVAIVKNDQYIPQDLVYRRAGQLIEEQCPSCGIGPENLTMAVTHDHSSPMYSSTSWGVWAFQDVFDIRNFEYLAQQMATAVQEAVNGPSEADDELSQALTPAQMAVRSTYFDKTHRHSFGPAQADNGTPAGYPQSDQDHDVSVIRFDKTDGTPLANLVNYSQHPEMLEGNDLISADYIGPFQRMMDRETGAVTVFTQGSVGTSEDERSSFHSIHERLEYPHRDYAQAEMAARLLANAARGAWERIGTDAPADWDGDPGTPPDKYLPYSAFGSGPNLQMADRWYPGPFSHPYPGVSNCRVDHPGVPVLGLPDCERVPFVSDNAPTDLGVPPPVQDAIGPLDPGLPIDTPENYSALAYSGLEEDLAVHLQAIRIGPLFLPICSCEQWWDQSRNIELRTNKIVGDEDGSLDSLGYDWGSRCTKNNDGTYPDNDDGLGSDTGTGTWDCQTGIPGSQGTASVSNHNYQVMRAQVNNPANGWNDLANVGTAEGEPDAPADIKGNYTHDDDATSAALGYDLTVPIAMSNDYNGYIASYREYSRGDHYRKALTGWGPHSSDYMASRLVTLGRQFNNPGYVRPLDQTQEDAFQPPVQAGLTFNNTRAMQLGQAAAADVAATEASLPNDGGTAGAVAGGQPKDIERFDASLFTWNGGSNYTDNPQVKVQRLVGSDPDNDSDWEDYADQSGELPVTLKFPSATGDGPLYAQGSFEWHWTARFEAMVAGSENNPVDTGHESPADRDPATPADTYRFVVDGERREGTPGGRVPYHVESDPFDVKPWSGILPQQFQLEPDSTMSFKVGPRSPFTHPVAACRTDGIPDEIGPVDYPDTHERADDPAPFIRLQRSQINDGTCGPNAIEWFCFTCTWRPWLDFGDADTAKVTVTLGNGTTEVVDATRQGDNWVTARKLRQNESAQVRTGNVLDPYGNTNQLSIILSNGTAPADADGDGDLDGADNCQFIANPGQEDADHDGIGDACDSPDPDADHDGIPDADDDCDAEPGPARPHPDNGCPIPPPVDTDHDGIVDSEDDCPTQAGPSGPPGTNGCPAPSPTDGDGDGVPDSADGCPNAPGPINDFGCPEAQAQPQPSPPTAQPANCASPRRGTQGRDTLLGTAGGELLLGLGAGDRLRGGDGPDCVFGGRGKDDLDGENGDDLVRGGDGRDVAVGGEGNDVVSGGRGRDLIQGGNGNDSLRAVDGDPDQLDCGIGADSAQIGPGDRTVGCERIRRVRPKH